MVSRMCKSFVDSYKEWVLKSPEQARLLEQMLSMSYMFIPQTNGWVDYQTGTEGMYAIANTVTLVNQIITADNAGNMKFDRHSRIRFGLSLLANFGQLSELIGTQAAGTTGKWFTAFLIEGLRAALKFLILIRTNFSHLIRGGKMIPTRAPGLETRIGARGGAILFASSFDCKPSTPTRIQVLAETLHVLRPLVELILRRIVSPLSWTPLVVAMTMDSISLWLSSVFKAKLDQSWIKDIPSPHAQAILEEIKARKYLLFFYLFRDPLFQSLTLPFLQKIQSKLEYIPLIWRLTQFLLTTLIRVQKMYLFASGSS